MSEPELPSAVSPLVVALQPEQMKLILENQQQFMLIFQQAVQQLLTEQAKTNDLLMALIEAVGQEDQEEPEPSIGSYLDGSPMR